ncbi:variable large family protein (plasmid) [Borrelia turicatae 91E135]|nr:variable large family protein [Borrelia turicatae 91E135]
MTLFLLLSCGSGSTKAEDPQSRFLKSVISLGNDFLNVFTSLSDMVGGVLGFNTKKSDIGVYFKKVHDTLSSTKTALEKIVTDMKSENNPNTAATETAINKLVSETLDKIIEGASEAVKGAEGNDSIASVGTANVGAAGEENAVKSLIEGIGKIVEVVLGNKGSADAGDNNNAENGNARNNNGAGKLFANANAGAAAEAKKVAADAAKAVGAVTGADILQAMVKNDAVTLAKHAGGAGAESNKKDAIIAGGIALRAIAKNGKFSGASDGDADAKKAIEGVALSAVTKALNTLTIAIRNTIDVGLKGVKDAMKINPEDIPPVTNDNTTSETKKN